MQGAADILRRQLAPVIAIPCVAISVFVSPQSQAQTTVIYTYDALGRMTAAAWSNGAYTNYAYDPAGNRTQVNGVGSPPTAANVSMSVAYNTSGSAALSPGGNYTSVSVAAGPAHGSVSISNTTATYTPASGYIGTDSFTYTATGPGGTSAAATVRLASAIRPHLRSATLI